LPLIFRAILELLVMSYSDTSMNSMTILPLSFLYCVYNVQFTLAGL